MRHVFARRLRGILIRERLNPADLDRRLGGRHRDEVAVRVSRSISSKVPRKRSAREDPPRETLRVTSSGMLLSSRSCVSQLGEQERTRRERRNAGKRCRNCDRIQSL